MCGLPGRVRPRRRGVDFVNQIQQMARYAPEGIEEKWYRAWEEAGLFKPRANEGGDAFVITLPPPNVTGILTVGHCLGNSIQDTLIRWMRMRGRETLWVPGTDHASISTEQVVQKQLREEGKDKRDLGRDAFLERAWQWKEKTHGRITAQLRRLGCSLDWSREAFTMDEARNRAVAHAFVELRRKGLIFRDLYLVNWCPHCLTAISDDEVQHKEIKGHMWSIRYPLADGNGHVTVATTRPETLFGDVAVAVHPSDTKRAHLVGQRVHLPLTERTIPIIADPHADPEKGTGFVKITPAHDPNDFEVGRRQELPQVICMDEHAVMNEEAGPFEGMDRFACRKAALEALSAEGLLEQEKQHVYQVGHHDRCGTVIEPYLSRQWFLKMGELARPAVEAVENGTIELFPERWVGVYYNWMHNIRDWCISRQLWWGHRIPVWYCQSCGKDIAAESVPAGCPQCRGKDLVQDSDVLDTWFSSWLWTFSPLGWPERTEDLARFHPTTVMVTAADIIFFWVARMIMASYEFLGEQPFGEVLFHGIVRDEQGRKMSKSLGNSPDPIALIDKYGADALRCSLVMLTPTGQDIFFSEASLEVGRNFCNKIFQATKLVLGIWEQTGWSLADERADGPKSLGAVEESSPAAMTGDISKIFQGESGGPAISPAAAMEQLWRWTFGADPPVRLEDADLDLEDLWILSRLCATVRDCNESMEQRRLNEAAYAVFNFFRHELCDWYLEAIKPRLRDEKQRAAALLVAVTSLGQSYKLLHPVMPYITEELWSWLPPSRGYLMVSAFPTFEGESPFIDALCRFELVKQIVCVIRNLRTELDVPPGKRGKVILRVPDSAQCEGLTRDAGRVALLAKLEEVQVTVGGGAPAPAGVGMAGQVEIFLLTAGLVDLDKERQRLTKELARIEGWVAGCRAKLANERFIESAPAEVIQKQQELLQENQAKAEKLAQRLAALKE
jgi:valyl-tRNA synthetase